MVWFAYRCLKCNLFGMRRTILLSACGLLAWASPAHAADNGWDTASDIGRNGLVVVALGLPSVQGDWQGTKQAALSIGSTSLEQAA